MTTDTYPKVVDPQRRDRRRHGDDQRHRQGRRHDRARHGDDAFLRRHRCRYRARGAAGAACPTASARPSIPMTVDSDTSTSDTLMLFATGAAAEDGQARIERADDPRACRLPCGTERCAEGSVAAGGARRRGRPQDARSHRDRRRERCGCQAHRAVDRQFAAGQDGGCRRRCQLGPCRHGRRQVRRDGRSRPAGDLVRRCPRCRRRRARSRLFGGRRLDRHEEAGYLRSASISVSAPARRRSGPATSPRNMSRSTATTGADRSLSEALSQKANLPLVRRLEAVGFRAWPAASVQYDGSWQVRLTAGHPSNRLNSIVPLDPSDHRDVEIRLEKASRKFEAYGRPAVLRQTPLASPVLIDLRQRRSNWTQFDETIVMTCDLPRPSCRTRSIICRRTMSAVSSMPIWRRIKRR